MILRYTPQARIDLHEIEDYIKNELSNPQAAARIIERMKCTLCQVQFLNLVKKDK